MYEVICGDMVYYDDDNLSADYQEIHILWLHWRCFFAITILE